MNDGPVSVRMLKLSVRNSLCRNAETLFVKNSLYQKAKIAYLRNSLFALVLGFWTRAFGTRPKTSCTAFPLVSQQQCAVLSPKSLLHIPGFKQVEYDFSLVSNLGWVYWSTVEQFTRVRSYNFTFLVFKQDEKSSICIQMNFRMAVSLAEKNAEWVQILIVRKTKRCEHSNH